MAQNVQIENPIQIVQNIPEVQQLQNPAQAQDAPNFNIFGNFDIMEMVAECERENEMVLAQQTTTMSQNAKSNSQQIISKKIGSPTIPTFNNCHISGNITINFQKHYLYLLLKTLQTSLRKEKSSYIYSKFKFQMFHKLLKMFRVI